MKTLTLTHLMNDIAMFEVVDMPTLLQTWPILIITSIFGSFLFLFVERPVESVWSGLAMLKLACVSSVFSEGCV